MVETFVDILMKTISTEEQVLTFLHNAPSKIVADTIINDGFRFQSHLDYSTDNVSSKDIVTVKYFALTRQAYGDYTVIMQISRSIIEHYSSILKNTPHHFSEVLTVKEPVHTSEDEYIFQLAPQFVKGYIYTPECQLVLSPDFNPNCDCEVFKKNLDKILNALNK